MQSNTRDLIENQFQPTPPAQGATRKHQRDHERRCDFNPRPPRRGRRGEVIIDLDGVFISTHAPRAGGDLIPLSNQFHRVEISTHAPRAGGDPPFLFVISTSQNFNPRPPRRGRRAALAWLKLSVSFQPTPPAQGATNSTSGFDLSNQNISTHAPRAGGDSKNNQNKTPDFP